jgi:hypothetical protein
MSSFRKAVTAGLLLIACGLTCGDTSNAMQSFPEWEGTWFRLHIKFRQCEFNHAKSKWRMDKGRLLGFLLLDEFRVGDPGDPGVMAAPMVIWEEDSDTGQGGWNVLHWEMTVLPAPDNVRDFLVFGLNEREENPGQPDEENQILAFTGRIRGREDAATGDLKGARMRSYGGINVEQSAHEYQAGSFSVKGRAIPAGKLPFQWPLQ